MGGEVSTQSASTADTMTAEQTESQEINDIGTELTFQTGTTSNYVAFESNANFSLSRTKPINRIRIKKDAKLFVTIKGIITLANPTILSGIASFAVTVQRKNEANLLVLTNSIVERNLTIGMTNFEVNYEKVLEFKKDDIVNFDFQIKNIETSAFTRLPEITINGNKITGNSIELKMVPVLKLYKFFNSNVNC